MRMICRGIILREISHGTIRVDPMSWRVFSSIMIKVEEEDEDVDDEDKGCVRSLDFFFKGLLVLFVVRNEIPRLKFCLVGR